METINAKYFPINTFSLETGCISNNFIVDSSISLEIISLDNITIRIIIIIADDECIKKFKIEFYEL